MPMLCRMAFHLSSKTVALHLNSNTAKAYSSDQVGTVCFSFQTGLPHFDSS